GAWLDAAQALETARTFESVRTLAQFIGESEAHACVAVLAQCCREGSAEACALAETLLAKLGEGTIPKPLLAADLAAARGSTEAVALYESLFREIAAGAAMNAEQLAQRVGSDAALRDAFRADPISIAAMNNLADFLVSQKESLDRAVLLARCVTTMVPEANEARDTLFRALLARQSLTEARDVAASNPDRFFSAVERAEVALAAKEMSQARAALADADTLATRRGLVPRALVACISVVRAALEAEENNAGGAS
ncbi:MAG: hypothetical protein ACKO3W_10775, partial [bacterium]